jgi:23S rRNA pseudouridine955/2504/2580 synthase
VPTLKIDRNDAGQRLDRFLKKALPGMPKGHIFKLLRTRKVRVNGRRAKGDRVLKRGDEIILHMDESQFQKDSRRRKRRAVGMDFKIIFEDEHLLVVSKPPFLPVHPGAGHTQNSLIDQVHAYLEADARPDVFRPSLAHRLDRDTSGLLLIGKSVGVLQELSRMLKEGRVEKRYLALARGVPRPRKGTWEFEVQRRDVPGKAQSKPRGRKDQAGRTSYRVAATRKLKPEKGPTLEISLLVLKLHTGRTHQIRSHLDQAGHPLLGDVRYGDRVLNKLLKKRYNLRRQFLHAFRLGLAHPETGKKLKLVDPYPQDLKPIAQSLRLGVPSA